MRSSDDAAVNLVMSRSSLCNPQKNMPNSTSTRDSKISSHAGQSVKFKKSKKKERQTRDDSSENDCEPQLKVKKSKKAKKEKKTESEVESKTSRKEETVKAMEPGDKIHCDNGAFRIVKILGSGALGDVYKVGVCGASGKFYAMKTERRKLPKGTHCLKYEVIVLKNIYECKDRERLKHFIRMVDRGLTTKYSFLVMTLIGPTLKEIRSDILKTDFTHSTAIRLGIQTFDAIADLHYLGYIHRDIKPSNFAIGCGKQSNVVYMFDFKLAQSIKRLGRTRMQGVEMRVYASSYASRNAHRQREQSRRDDLESWLYMAIEFFDRKLLPWRNLTNGELIRVQKEQFFRHQNPEMYKSAPSQFRAIADKINQTRSEEEPNYENIMLILIQVKKKIGCAMDDPYDWDIGEKPMRREFDSHIELKKHKSRKHKEDKQSSINSTDNESDVANETPEKAVPTSSIQRRQLKRREERPLVTQGSSEEKDIPATLAQRRTLKRREKQPSPTQGASEEQNFPATLAQKSNVKTRELQQFPRQGSFEKKRDGQLEKRLPKMKAVQDKVEIPKAEEKKEKTECERQLEFDMYYSCHSRQMPVIVKQPTQDDKASVTGEEPSNEDA
uniref:Protein kinase domain-containing protein n=1 Tax=Steinernema glaseri TaxID=37863 RepID=A0A1I7XXL5_9BILA